MDNSKIKIGTKFEIEIPEVNKKDTGSFITYSSQLIDSTGKNTMIIAAPMNKNRFKFLSAGLNILVYYLNSRQELLYFMATVKEHIKSGPLDAFEIAVTSDAKKIQRRKFYRLDASLSCQYKIIEKLPTNIDNFDLGEIDTGDLAEAYTKNISGSGFCLNLNVPLDEDIILYAEINLEDTAIIKVLSQVIRSEKIDDKKYEAGLHYLKISPVEAKTLIKYIYEKQRLILKNTLQSDIKHE